MKIILSLSMVVLFRIEFRILEANQGLDKLSLTQLISILHHNRNISTTYVQNEDVLFNGFLYNTGISKRLYLC